MAKFNKNIHGVILITDTTPLHLIQARIHNALRQAMFMYRDELKKRIGRWGSIPLVGGVLRLRLIHSTPGQPPRKQTENLYNSIKTDTFAKPNLNIATQFRLPVIEQGGAVFTDVPYAPSLERGGMSVLGAPTPYTSWQLVNPIMKVIRILPRPAWRPVWNFMIKRMFNRILKGTQFTRIK